MRRLLAHHIITLPLVASEIFNSHDGFSRMLRKSGNVRSTLLRIQRNNAENSKKFTEALEAFLIANTLTSPA